MRAVECIQAQFRRTHEMVTKGFLFYALGCRVQTCREKRHWFCYADNPHVALGDIKLVSSYMLVLFNLF